LQQDLIEEAVGEAMQNYTACECGNIAVTCSKCNCRSRGRELAASLVLKFNADGLAALTRRICEKLKKRVSRRGLTAQQCGVEESDNDGVRLDWNASRQVEDNVIARIDAGRGHADWNNAWLREFLRTVLTPEECDRVRETGKLEGVTLARVRRKLEEHLLKCQ
jgi:hypothetical protein